jgi:hypothetical protein
MAAGSHSKGKFDHKLASEVAGNRRQRGSDYEMIPMESPASDRSQVPLPHSFWRNDKEAFLHAWLRLYLGAWPGGPKPPKSRRRNRCSLYPNLSSKRKNLFPVAKHVRDAG